MRVRRRLSLLRRATISATVVSFLPTRVEKICVFAYDFVVGYALLMTCGDREVKKNGGKCNRHTQARFEGLQFVHLIDAE